MEYVKKKLAFLAGHSAKVVFKNCLFLSEVINPHGRVILMLFKKCLYQFPVSAVYEFFSGNIFNFFKNPFSMSEFADFKNINIKKLA